MVSNVRNNPPNTFPIANLATKKKEAAAANYDVEGKGYLTYDQLIAWFQTENEGRLPNLSDLAKFLGKPQHELAVDYLNGWEILQSQWLAGSWKGDFHVDALRDGDYTPAGNVRIGREIGPQFDPVNNRQVEVDQLVFLVDFNLIKLADFDAKVKSATLVIGPAGFPKEHNKAKYGEAVEVPMTLLSESSSPIPGRYGPQGWSPEKKLAAAQIDTGDLAKLAGAAPGLSFYIRLETHDNRVAFVNKDGQPFQNFDVSADELRPAGQP
ncbi:MAG: hypothetical protein IPG45_16455 [Deltaproteobacteria bacterium]|jgi:hypothetical protein|nr:hypothetical protein [Deltaproteobacteria bacterium]